MKRECVIENAKERQVYDLLERYSQYEEKVLEVESMRLGLMNDCQNLDIESFNHLSYKELKEIKGTIMQFLSESTLKRFLELVNIKREEEYPELLGAVYFPRLNSLIGELNITQYEVKRIDRLFLSHYKRGLRDKVRQERIRDILQTDEKVELVSEFLRKNNIADLYYLFECKCRESCCPVKIKESTIKKHMFVWEFDEQTEGLNAYEIAKLDKYDQYSMYEDRGMGIISVNCHEGEWYDITDKNEFENAKKTILFSIKMVPDLTYENI